MIDSSGSKMRYYPEVSEVLSDLHNQGYVLAVASRTGEIQGAFQLVELFGWKKYFSNLQIYPGMKTTHLSKWVRRYEKQILFWLFLRIKNTLGVQFSEILFFDDESRNIKDVSELGVLSILVKNGVTKKVVDDALNQFARQKQKAL